MRAMCSTAVGQSFMNVPNGYIDVLSVNQVNAADRGRTASDVQGEQVGMKKARHKNKNAPMTIAGQGNADVLATTDTMTQSEGTEKAGAPARDRGSGLRQ